MTEFITKELTSRTTGLSLHYPFIYASVVGLAAEKTLEFGAGGSTRVFTDALDNGKHYSISTEDMPALRKKYDITSKNWTHTNGKSEDARTSLNEGPFDIILHDGSHAANVVADDIEWAFKHLRTFGLLLVHDIHHSYVGGEMRQGIKKGLDNAGGEYTATTLPYGFGLSIIRKEPFFDFSAGETLDDSVTPGLAKTGSSHFTELTRFYLPPRSYRGQF